MERFNEIGGPAMMQLAHQRRRRRGQPEPGQEERRIVDADPSGSPAPMLPAPTVSCRICNDDGYLRANVPFGHPQFGKAVECLCTQEKRQASYRHALREHSKLDDLTAFQQASFETFQLWLPGIHEAYEAAKQFAQTPQGWLVLAGGNGCGKTHLAVAIAKDCLEQGVAVLFAVVPDLLDRLRAAFSPHAGETFDEEFRTLREVEVLILDDLGSEQSTPWATEKLFQLLNYRYNARFPTVVTTNTTHFEGVAPRLRSRLCDRHVVRTIHLAEAQDVRALELGTAAQREASHQSENESPLRNGESGLGS